MADDEAARSSRFLPRCGGPAVFRPCAKLVRSDSWRPQCLTAKVIRAKRGWVPKRVEEANTPEAKNNTIEYRWAEGRYDRLPRMGGRSCSWSRLKLEPVRCWVDLPATTLLHRSRLKLSYRTKL